MKYCDCNSERWYKELKKRELTPLYDIYFMLLDDYEKEPHLFTPKVFKEATRIETYLFAICLALKWRKNKEPLGFPVERIHRFFYNLNKQITE
jgi:hypothetical protein